MGKKVKKKPSNSKFYLIKISFFFPKLQHSKSVDIFTLS